MRGTANKAPVMKALEKKLFILNLFECGMVAMRKKAPGGMISRKDCDTGRCFARVEF